MYHHRITNRPGLRRRQSAHSFALGMFAGLSVAVLILFILALLIP